MAQNLDPRELAVAAQLRAEIAGSKWKKIAAFSRALTEAGEPTDYTTFFNRVSGKTPMPTSVLLASLDLLGIDWVRFMTSVVERIERESAQSPA